MFTSVVFGFVFGILAPKALGLVLVKFYDQLADIYDLWVPWKERSQKQIPFYERLFQELRASRVLDAGCGTGPLAVELACRGYEVTAIDSSARMVELTKQRTEKRDADVQVHKADLCKPFEGVNGVQDVVLCLEGTVAHFFDRNALLGFLRNVKKWLRPNGALVLHLPNFQRLLNHRPHYLPVQGSRPPKKAKSKPSANAVIEPQAETLFISRYDYGQSRIGMDLIVLQSDGGPWTQAVYHTAYYPWTAEELIEILREEGFEEPLTYGDFDYGEFNPDVHEELLIVAEAAEKIE